MFHKYTSCLNMQVPQHLDPGLDINFKLIRITFGWIKCKKTCLKYLGSSPGLNSPCCN